MKHREARKFRKNIAHGRPRWFMAVQGGACYTMNPRERNKKEQSFENHVISYSVVHGRSCLFPSLFVGYRESPCQNFKVQVLAFFLRR